MIITNLKGGLGNQMFQYAAGLAHSKKLNTTHKIVTKHFDYNNPLIKETAREFELNYFNVHYNSAYDIEVKQIKEPYGLFSKIVNLINFYLQVHSFISFPIQLDKNTNNLYLDGHYQSEDYFLAYEDLIRKEFTLKKDFKTTDFNNIKNQISESKDSSISIHIRRGDYVSNKNANRRHGTLGLRYYENAWNYIVKKTNNQHVFFFSDDIDWAEKNFSFIRAKKTFVSKYNFNAAQEITLMSYCAHNIIANSSFSWWGAWLNTHKAKIVIAPSKWLRNGDGKNKRIVPTSWIRI